MEHEPTTSVFAIKPENLSKEDGARFLGQMNPPSSSFTASGS